ncbi:hypothetical protein N7E81_00835 [Reichenbachiella carrageenanivorans]|uniref:Chemotaxis methyl-accepting receptor HlyB-like 4HB MCP domain-containing protein n=1 Tax=Reichenbachiella carrageenanivorans TaxID=2979869 RepID=A0ABY6D741_9BACT|nr:hypothetical protein [Reichenbachiella carrageenanivorans]UXX79655.1 hypothetical protein N7E81_00835 [Reichenbachiella carrageenanivorans]
MNTKEQFRKMPVEKKTTAISSILLILGSIAVLHLVNMLHDELTVDRALAPMKSLSNARHLIVNGDYRGAVNELEDAMMQMRVIEQYTDSASEAHMDRAVEDLELVEKEIRSDNLIEEDLNRAFFNSLNSIAYACMLMSEHNLDKGENYKALHFMNATFQEMIASLKYVKDDELKHKEEKVIAHVRHILDKMESTKYTYKFDYDLINHELEELIEN